LKKIRSRATEEDLTVEPTEVAGCDVGELARTLHRPVAHPQLFALDSRIVEEEQRPGARRLLFFAMPLDFFPVGRGLQGRQGLAS
jgi:hypothetical protein